jgi:uncharacterized protein DUF4439
VSPLQALQRTLAAEHAALYVFGVLGGRVSDSREPTLRDALTAAYTTHRARRDRLTAMVRSAGGEPVAAELSYRLPTPCRTADQLRTAALTVERRCADVYAAAVASTADTDRRWAIDALTDCAVRQLSFGGAPEPYPGLPEL